MRGFPLETNLRNIKLNVMAENVETLPKSTLELMIKSMGKGWRNELAERSGYSTTYVYYVMRGKRHNDGVISSAREIIRDRKEEEKKEAERLESLASEIEKEIKE